MKSGILGFSAAMEKQQNHQVSENDLLLTISRKSMPIDLLISIFSRLPVKSIARFRCVSKQWASILCRREFTDLFRKISSKRPCLLFTLKLNGKWLFFSVTQRLNSDQNSCLLAADRHMSFPTEDDGSYGFSLPVCGLLCTKERNPFICNPSTGHYITLPKVTTSPGSRVSIYFGYDPIDKLFKVLRMSSKDYPRVLTLGTGQVSWRMIDCSIPHSPLPDGICINGVVYYLAAGNGTRFHKPIMLVCFDVRFEKFKFLDVDNMIWRSTLINFKGKLGTVLPGEIAFFSGRTIRLELWVLDDAENQKWSKHIYELPSLWKNLVGDNLLYVVGMTGTDDIVFSPYYDLEGPFYIFYYNLVRNTVVRVEIQLGIVVPEGHKIYTFIDHVQDVKLMEVLGSS